MTLLTTVFLCVVVNHFYVLRQVDKTLATLETGFFAAGIKDAMDCFLVSVEN